jgi:ATP-dependent Clp protease ATP-binding subunit ClpC
VRLTAAAEAAWMIAAGEAASSGHARIEPAHLLIGVLSLGKIGSQADAGGLAIDAALVRRENDRLLEALVPLRLDTMRLRRRARTRLGRGSALGPPGGPLSRSLAAKAIFAAAAEFAGAGEAIGVAHLLAALAEGVDTLTADLVRGMRVDPAALRAAALQAAGPEPSPPGGAGDTPLLDRYGRDLTELARRGELAPVFGRRREILAVLQTLARGTRHVPVLVGERGIGKTAVIEAIAMRAAEGSDPAVLAGRRIVELGTGTFAVAAGVEGKVDALVAELRAHPEVLLFVDDLHLLAPRLAPALARGELRCIGAASVEEYRELEALLAGGEARLEGVTVEEPDREEALEILRGLRPILEKQHDAGLPDEALEAAVDLSVRFEVDRRLPEKAIGLLELAALHVRRRALAPASTTDPSAEPAGIEPGADAVTVTAESVARALAEKRGLPAALVLQDLSGGVGPRLTSLEGALAERIVGQDDAIGRIVRRLRLAFAAAPTRPGPLAVLLFVGPDGVGKSEAARVVAGHLFGTAWGMIRVDVSELTDGDGVARLVGSPPGRRPLEDEGLLTAAIRAKPHALLLLDEIEKAHPRVLEVLLQILGEGRLTDAGGRSTDARRLVVVMTSGLDEATIRRRYPPALLAHADEIIAFRALDAEDVAMAVGRALAEIVSAVERRHGVRLRVTPGATRFLAERAAADGPGASAARSVAERLVQGPLSALVVAGKLSRHTSWKAEYDEGGIYILPER